MNETVPNIDLYWSFRSPYSYLATPGTLEVAEKFDVTIRFRPVLPLAVRVPGFFSPENLGRVKYILIDWERRAEMLGMSHVWPSPDPIVQDLETFQIAEDQPYIYRLTYLGVEAERRGHGIQFAAEVSKVLFGGTKDWHLGDHLAGAAERAGLNLQDMEQAIQQSETHHQEVEQNQGALEVAGHWGVPTFVFNQEPFFGQDRIDTLCWRLNQAGLLRKNQ